MIQKFSLSDLKSLLNVGTKASANCCSFSDIQTKQASSNVAFIGDCSKRAEPNWLPYRTRDLVYENDNSTVHFCYFFETCGLFSVLAFLRVR